MHCAFPNVVRLQVHLPGQQYVTWNQNGQQTIQEVANNAAERDTTLTAYFKANLEYLELTHDVLYQDFHQSSCGIRRHASGSPDSVVLLSEECTMLSLLPESASTSDFF